MTLAPVAQDVTAVYTSRALVERWLPAGAITTNADSASGKVNTTDLTNLILRASRRLDADLMSHGFAAPFPTITASNPATPDKVVEIATYRVVGEVRSILAHGNRKQGGARQYLDMATDALEALIERPASIGYGRVTTADDFLTKVFGTSSAQYGRMNGQVYRLRNRNVVPGSLRFVTSAGVEVSRPEGYPFTEGVDFAIVDAAEGVVALFNESAIIAAVGASGGAVYDVSWRRLDFGRSHGPTVTGVRVP